MNTERILAVLKADGFYARSKFGESGIEIGVRVRGESDLWVVGLAPIDDESDIRFVDALEAKARKTKVELENDWDLIPEPKAGFRKVKVTSK